ncbi:MAG: system TPR-repeat lipoprotein [Rhodocyclaceae bacterium]|nr:system TPR-repeat lipoprotein [Rhodocyclaceae bacterium]
MTACFPLRLSALALALAAVCLPGCKDQPPETLLASARDYLARKDSRAAIIQAKNALQKRPDLPEARFLLGKALLESGDAAGAELEARKALELKYPGDQAVPLLAETLMAQGKAAEVIDKYAGTELPAGEGRANLLTLLAMAHALQGARPAAEAALMKALETQPGYGPALLVQARLMAAGGDYPGALVRLETALAKLADRPEPWKLKGDILSAQGHGAEALVAYRKALEIRPDAVPIHDAVIGALLQQGKVAEAEQQLEALEQVAPKNPQTRYLQLLMAYRKGDYKAARGYAQALLQVAPDNPNALQLAGAVEYQQGAWPRAESHLTKALAIVPDLPLARRLLVSTFLRSGQAGKAQEALLPVLEKIGGDPQMLALAGQVYVHTGELQKAEQYFAKAVALDPQDAGKRTSLALTRLGRGQPDTALAELERIAAADKGMVADLALATSLLQRKEFDQALQAIAALERKQPGQPLAPELRGRALAAKGDRGGARRSLEQALAADPAYFPAVLGLARLDLADGKPEDAKQRFQRMLAADPGNFQALLALAEVLGRTGARADAIQPLLARAVATAPSEPAPRLALIEYHLRNKDAAHAVAAAREAADALPERPEILDALGAAQLAARDFNQALGTYGKLAGLDPKSALPHLRMADVHLAAGRRDDALASLRKALALAPSGALAARLHGVLQEQDGGDAGRFAAAWLKDHPKDAGFLFYLGDRAIKRQDYPGAIRYYRTLLEIQPDNAPVLNNLAWVAGQQKDPQAIEYAEKANRLAPNQPALMDTLAMLVLEKGDARRAVSLLQKAVELAPGIPSIRLNYAKALIRAGNKTAARQELETLAKLGDRFSGQAEIARLLSQV